ncbi:STAS domain-containing protein [Streptomyces glomeratus]|uniref:Anti-sigma factor antagonist n=1 Tax=Streptomyces glomeratus TaxID=284452 RepID=A0ABP6LYI5_9ACTN|nr:STAS domain-containing protein [Streptomyces glomeratus]MCF1512614.1 STAS domain-containing protein [Streptomyces glomeratus]
MREIPSGSSSGHPQHVGSGTTLVRLRGEIDILAALALGPRLDALTAGPRPDLVLDLRPVSFIDCSGLSLLCRARNRVVARGGRLRLVVDGTPVLRVLRYARLADVFEIGRHPPAEAVPVPVPDAVGLRTAR